MAFWFILLLGVVVLFIAWQFYKRRNMAGEQLANIRAQWGHPVIKHRNLKQVATYLNLNTNYRNVSDQTATDIDLQGVFEYIDRTSSKPGEQYLYQKLHKQETGADYFDALEQRIEHFTKDAASREHIQLKLSKLNSSDAYHLPSLFSKKHQSLFSQLVEFYIRVSAIVTVMLLVLLIMLPNQLYLFLLMGMVVTNMVIHFRNKSRVLNYTRSLPQLLILYDVGKWLFKTHASQNEAVEQSLPHLAKLKRSLKFINLQSAAANDPTDLAYLLIEWLNMLLLIEPLIFLTSIKKVNQYLADIQTVYEFVAEIDMAISIQSVRAGLPYWCKPAYALTINQFVIKDVYHPLVEGCIPNSISTNNSQGVLITGSNMSGKTTFIRALTINTLLAQTIHTCCAKVYEAPLLKLFTSININDDIHAHKSYFQAEALSVLNIIDHCKASQPVKSLIVIDEIFRGTNTIERVAAAKAVLAYLIANQNFVFVSTHDLELAKLLGDDYAVYSFEEMMGDKRLIFDYKIKKGLLKNKNGIAVLQGMGYPQTIIDDANQVSKMLRDKYEL